jgi:rod shape-determining protein MreD
MRVFPGGQLMVAVLSLLTLYQFMLFWINGVAGVEVDAVRYWGPVVSGTILWPLVSRFLSSARMRVQ